MLSFRRISEFGMDKTIGAKQASESEGLVARRRFGFGSCAFLFLMPLLQLRCFP
jgi:hypothetical protein